MSVATFKKIKVTYLINDLVLGGAQKLILDIGKNINMNEYEIEYVCLYDFRGIRTNFHDQLIANGFKVRYVLNAKEKNNHFQQLKILRKILKTSKPDVLHMHLPNSVIIGTIASLCMEQPIKRILHEHQERRMLSWKINFFMNLACKLASCVIYYSNFVEKKQTGKESILNFLSTDTLPGSDLFKNGFTVLNGVDVDEICRQTDDSNALYYKKTLNLRADSSVISASSRLLKWKGQRWLLANLNAYLKQNEKVVLLIAGDGPDMDYLKKYINENKLSRQVFLLGALTNICNLLAITDVYISVFDFDSGCEAVSISINSFEAMAASLPVIIGKGIDDTRYIESGVNGFIVDKNNNHGFIEIVDALLKDDKLRRSVGKNAHNFIRQKLDMKKIVKIYEWIYKEII